MGNRFLEFTNGMGYHYPHRYRNRFRSASCVGLKASTGTKSSQKTSEA